MSGRWIHNGGSEQYPLPCVKFTDDRESWKWIQERHAADAPYNLVYTPAGVYCFARKFQGSYQHAEWTSGFAWYECAGSMITFCESDYGALTSDMILGEFEKMRDD